MSRKKDTQRFWKHHDKESYECPECGATQNGGAVFEVHHQDGNAENGKLNNLIGLCRDCHWEVHNINPGKRQGHWSEEYFNEWRSENTPLKYF